MASNWIKLEVITPDKPEIFRLAEILNIDPDAALGKVIRFWAWADQQMIDGNAECNARGVTKSAIDRITFMAGFADALIQVGWLVETNGVLSLPNFERHNGKSSKKRAVTNERVTKIRELKRKGNAASVTKTDQKALPEEEKEEDINTYLPLNPPRQKRASKNSNRRLSSCLTGCRKHSGMSGFSSGRHCENRFERSRALTGRYGSWKNSASRVFHLSR